MMGESGHGRKPGSPEDVAALDMYHRDPNNLNGQLHVSDVTRENTFSVGSFKGGAWLPVYLNCMLIHLL